MNPITQKLQADKLIRMALEEDITSEDVSTNAVMPDYKKGKVQLLCKQDGVICGLGVFLRTFELLDENTTAEFFVRDGDEVKKGQLLAEVTGDIRVLLSGERVALNYLQHMSGVATYTRAVAKLLEGSETKLLDTRKTTPNMRVFEKYAVRVGGGNNHRYNLSDGVLLKDNHIGAAGGVAAAVVGLLVGLPALRLKGDYLAIVTLACGEIIKTIINNLSVTGGAKGLDTSAIYADTRTLLPFAIVLIFLVVLVMMNLKNSRHGRAIMAIRDNRIAAESNGVNVTYYKLMVFVLAAFFAGMAGVLYGHTLANIKPAMFDYNMSIEILVIVVLGGMGSIRGSIIATIILRALPEVLRQVADYRMLAYSVLLIVIMLLNSSPQFAEWKGRWSLKALLSLGKTRKEKTKKEAAKK